MILEDTLKNIIEEHQKIYFSHKQVTREVSLPENIKRVILITGVRRCGKSTLMRQLIPKTQSIYLNFEDPRLEDFEVGDFEKVERIGIQNGCKYFLFDEIQNVDAWEKAIRIMNEKGLSLYISGSNAGMLSRELGTRLTGRYKQIELFPYSYIEFLRSREMKAKVETFEEYMELGGFPEYLLEEDPEYLRTLLRDIITRDIAVRRGIRNEQNLIRLAVHLLSNIGKEFSFNNITHVLEIKSVRTTVDYCDYLEESYLLESIPKFSWSIKKQLANPKKIYCVDNALAKANSLSFSKDLGRMLKNIVYLNLRRKSKEIYYYKGNNKKSECDFLIKEGGTITKAIQVCYKLSDENINRELKGLKEAMQESKCTDGIIITVEQEDIIDGITVVPAWKWLQY